jgi:hypothetical protein
LTARQIFIAPLRTIPVPRADWIPITDDKGLNRNAVWAANGQRVYFLSDHDGFRCIWARNLEAATKRPVGDAFAVYHAHSARVALTSIAVGQISLSATKDQVFYSQPELSGNVWMVETAAESK